MPEVNVGSTANSGTGDPLRTAFIKINADISALKEGLDAIEQVPDAVALTQARDEAAQAAGQAASSALSASAFAISPTPPDGLGTMSAKTGAEIATLLAMSLKNVTDDAVAAVAAVAGKVTGPMGAINNRIAVFDGLTGGVVKDSGALVSDLAPMESPALTGTPTAPTAAAGTNTTQLATTAFVQTAVPVVSDLAPMESPALTGTPTAPTAAAGTNTTQLATTAFVQAAVPVVSAGAKGMVPAPGAPTGRFLRDDATWAAVPALEFSAVSATLSGSSVDIDGVPAEAREIEVYFVAATGSGNMLVQLLTGAGAVTAGYTSASGTSGAEFSATNGFIIANANAATGGILRLIRIDTGLWVSAHSVRRAVADASGGGSVSGVATVTGIRLTLVTGTFSAGNFAISWR